MQLEKYDEAGNLLWSQVSGGSNTDVLIGIAGIDNRLFAVGYTQSQGAGGADAVLLEIDPAMGDILSTTLFGGTQDDIARGIATDGTSLYVVGESRSFASAAGNIVGQNDLIFLRYNVCQYVLAGDLNDDCRVDFYDLATMAANWLVDCDVTPGDPACVSK